MAIELVNDNKVSADSSKRTLWLSWLTSDRHFWKWVYIDNRLLWREPYGFANYIRSKSTFRTDVSVGQIEYMFWLQRYVSASIWQCTKTVYKRFISIFSIFIWWYKVISVALDRWAHLVQSIILSTPLLYFYYKMYETKIRAKLMDLYYCWRSQYVVRVSCKSRLFNRESHQFLCYRVAVVDLSLASSNHS